MIGQYSGAFGFRYFDRPTRRPTMTNLNYQSPRTLRRKYGSLIKWADSRSTDLSVAFAIHAIASNSRSPQAIWEAPTSSEDDNVQIALAQYLDLNFFDRSDDNNYRWGLETITIAETKRTDIAAYVVSDPAGNYVARFNERLVAEVNAEKWDREHEGDGSYAVGVEYDNGDVLFVSF
jgi:hypothetical protein